jgi:hypothetical protein
MVDFQNKKYLKLKQDSKYVKRVIDMVVPGEEIIEGYSAGRDGIVFTTMRMIILNVQGLTGKKTDYTSIPFKKISMYSIETSGAFDMDAELTIVVSGVGEVKFEFKGRSNMKAISQYISHAIL